MQAPREQADIKFFKTEEEAEAFKKGMEVESGLLYSDIGHSGDWYWCGYIEVGELLSKAVTEAGNYYKLNVELTAGYQIGRDWSECH